MSLSEQSTVKATVVKHFEKMLFNDSEHFKGFLNDISSRDTFFGGALDIEIEKITDSDLRDDIRASFVNYANNSKSEIEFNKAVALIEPLIFLADDDLKLQELGIKLLIKILAVSKLNFGIPENYISKITQILSHLETENENLDLVFVYFKVYYYTINKDEYFNDSESFLTSKYFQVLKKICSSEIFSTTVIRQLYVLIRSAEQFVTINPKYKSLFVKYDNLFIDLFFGKILFSKSYSSSDSTSGIISTSMFSSGSAKKNITSLPPTNSLSVQLQYYTLILLWVLTFDGKFVAALTTKYQTYALKLINLANSSSKLKVTRVALAILHQILVLKPSFIDKIIVTDNSDIILNNLSNRNLQDEELNESLKFILDTFNDRKNKLNNIETYKLELNSKKLIWSTNHINLKFWEDNILQFKTNNYELVHKLIDLLPERITEHGGKSSSSFADSHDHILLNSDEVTTVQVVLNDLSKIMELLPDSIDMAITKKKLKIMSFLNYPDTKIKYEALKCTQVLIRSSYK
ncbi:hypothetical protein QEN19_003511 [Hanseniaspora menglaensis]